MKKANMVTIIKKAKVKGKWPKGEVPPPLVGKGFKKGHPGGPGRPPGAFGNGKISDAYRVMLTAEAEPAVLELIGLPEGTTWADAIAFQQLRRAVGSNGRGTGDVKESAVTELREVTEGKVAERSELTGANGAPLAPQPINVNFVRAKDGKREDEDGELEGSGEGSIQSGI